MELPARFVAAKDRLQPSACGALTLASDIGRKFIAMLAIMRRLEIPGGKRGRKTDALEPVVDGMGDLATVGQSIIGLTVNRRDDRDTGLRAENDLEALGNRA